jgi:aminopeptidase N
VEGLATLSQIDYAADVLNPTADRQTYLEWRYREHDILMRYTSQGALPAVVPPNPVNAGANDTLWAYFRGSATLDTLRLLIGDEEFGDALHTWAATCAMEHCDTADFKATLEAAGSVDLTAAFNAYVYHVPFVEPALSFTQSDGQVNVTATGITLPIMIDLWLMFDDHTHAAERVTLVPDVASAIAVTQPVRAVRPNPRHDTVVRSRSLTEGDITFDGAVDGLDIIACARAMDSAVSPGMGTDGLNLLDLAFDPRCDRDGTGAIDTTDMNNLLALFGTESP